MPSAGVDKLKLGLERLSKAGSDADLLGAALTSIHGALEDRFRHLLAMTPELSQADHARILDVARVQWAELIDLMRLHRNLSAEDATLIRTMNRERQEIAHGARFRGRRAAIERYATFVRGFFPEFEQPTIVVPQLPPYETPSAEPVAKPRKANSKREQLTSILPVPEAKPSTSRVQAKLATTKPVATPPTETKAAAKPRTKARQAEPTASTRTPRQLNPGLMLTLALLLLVFCAGGSRLIQSQNQGDTPAATTPFAAPLPTIAQIQQRITTAELNLRTEPGITSVILATIPNGTSVEWVAAGPQRDGHTWVRIRYGAQEGWVDQAFLK